MTTVAIPAEAFATLARARLSPRPPGLLDPLSNPRGDHSLNPDLRPSVAEREAKPAAVLVPIVAHEGDLTVLLTQRHAGLRAHSGQIAFPGGRMDPGEIDPLDTALREAEEEIGLPPALVQPLGYLDAYLSGTGYRIVPVVGLVPAALSLTLNPHEVTETFETPLGVLMDPARHELHSREWNGRERYFYAIPHDERYIWGVTAGIIRNLYEKLYGDEGHDAGSSGS